MIFLDLRFLTGSTSADLENIPITPGTLYFTEDRKIYFDSLDNERLCMDNDIDGKIATAVQEIDNSLEVLRDLISTNSVSISKIQAQLKQHDNYFDTYVLSVDYSPLEFDTTELIIDGTTISTVAILGQAILGQCTLG